VNDDEMEAQMEYWKSKAKAAEAEAAQLREALGEAAVHIAIVRGVRHGAPTGDDCPHCKLDQSMLDTIGAALDSLVAERDAWKVEALHHNAEEIRLREALTAWQKCSPAHRYECSPFASEDAVCSCGLQEARDLTDAALGEEA